MKPPKSWSVAVFVMALAVCGDCVAAQDSLTIYDSKTPCEINVIKLDSLIGYAALGLGDQKLVTDAMTCMVKLWHESSGGGATRSYLSNGFLVMMQLNPARFVSIITASPDVLREWLPQVGELSFTWENEPPCPLDVKRRQIVRDLEHVKPHFDAENQVRRRMLEKFKSIRCTQVN